MRRFIIAVTCISCVSLSPAQADFDLFGTAEKILSDTKPIMTEGQSQNTPETTPQQSASTQGETKPKSWFKVPTLSDLGLDDIKITPETNIRLQDIPMEKTAQERRTIQPQQQTQQQRVTTTAPAVIQPPVLPTPTARVETSTPPVPSEKPSLEVVKIPAR